ncbi:hypothetical protein EUGRSUZ_E03698 [Eucalyptus grandis]|uniref:Uncharacterized protein n=2 Tax=Eucalyptus grandis TaxID=71139 RepID=A0ACC3L072_EUCGR|nr:hypothetical protein EUGRSUZ_E03698 [Eucalyptus grandis]
MMMACLRLDEREALSLRMACKLTRNMISPFFFYLAFLGTIKNPDYFKGPISRSICSLLVYEIPLKNDCLCGLE